MKPLKPQKIYVDENARPKDQQGGGKEPERSLWGLFNDLTDEKSQAYRRRVYGRASALELKIEEGLKNVSNGNLCAAWTKALEDIQNARTTLKVGMSDRAISECMKAYKLNKKLEKLEKKCPF